jgi:hypothetical protein
MAVSSDDKEAKATPHPNIWYMLCCECSRTISSLFLDVDGRGGDILCLELGGTRESCLYVFRYGTILLPEREGETFDNIKLESHSSSRGACS